MLQCFAARYHSLRLPMSKARQTLRERVHAKYGGCCAYCGVQITLKQMQVDHITPRYLSYAHQNLEDFENLNPACRPCNNFKQVWTLEEFRHQLSEQVDRCRRYSVNFRNAERFGLLEVKRVAIVFYFERQKVQLNEVRDG